MTEEEIEDLQWQLGDFGPVNGYGSRGRKRGKDVIDMTIEEMEAEIQETNEAIRKRRRRNPGLMLKPLWMLTVFACLVRSPVAAFTAYDCSNRSNVVESYSLLEPDACANMGRDGEVSGDHCIRGDCPNQAGQDDPRVQVYGDRDPRGAVL
jgi:hypothetical protein